MDPALRRLVRGLARSQEATLRAADMDAQRARFLLHALTDAPLQRARVRRAAALALCAAAAALLVLWLRPARIDFQVGGAPGRDGAWVAASAREPLPLVFSEGSRVALRPGARARVLSRTRHGARIVLEQGQLTARIVHDAATRWRVDAGPFQVHVVGTHFDVAWHDERFELALHEGAVRVLGPTLPTGRLIHAGERLQVTLGSAAQAAPPAAPTVTQVPVPQAALALPGRVSGKEAPSWRRLAAAGAHERAFQVLSEAGFERVVRSASAADLRVLADIARFTHHTAHAALALRALYTRFGRDVQANDAAFLLGRLAFDQGADPAEAARWFATYLAEQPQGAFAREASGRAIECHERRGDSARARSAAQHYLDAYGAGPHAALARDVLARTDPDRAE